MTKSKTSSTSTPRTSSKPAAKRISGNKVRRAPSTFSAAAGAKVVSQDRIAQRAYEIWQQRGQPTGQDREHWLQAESELSQRPK